MLPLGSYEGSGPGRTGRVVDVRDLVYRIGRPGLNQIPGAVAVIVLPETLPVAGRIQRPALAELGRSDRRVAGVSIHPRVGR
jgi:hypothetical protein